MLTVLEVLQRTTEHFTKAGLEKPKVDAEWILAHGLGCSRLKLFLQFEDPLSDDVLEKLRPMVRRRAKREPLQYILGRTPFMDLNLITRAGALIPRPETEEMVDLLIRQADTPPATILDLGTGSGAIALALAQAFPAAKVTATDTSEQALQLARENAEQCQLGDRIDFITARWFDGIEGTFDWIVSNPPYLSGDEWEQAAPEVKDYEPRQALTAGPDGLSDLSTILQSAHRHLNNGGMLTCETGIGQHPALMALAQQVGYQTWESKKDFSNRPRIFQAWR